MQCGYCNGTGQQHWNDEHGDETDDCVYCHGAGTALCESCGSDAEFVDDDGDYTCGDCWQESLMDGHCRE